jgi:hypothetical protein
MEKTLLSILYISGKAFGWCLVSFCLMWAIFVGFNSLLDLWYAGVGLIFIIGSELAFIKLTGGNYDREGR